MSRKIKYRVWDNENKSYNDPYPYAYYALTQDGELDFYCHGDRMDEADPDVYFIEQYTGINDKNGNEIYEGDIVRVSYGYNYEVRQFRTGAWRIGRDDLYTWADSSEVIGNIHENSELLGDTNVTDKER